jgi:DNA mismatch repair protein MutL
MADFFKRHRPAHQSQLDLRIDHPKGLPSVEKQATVHRAAGEPSRVAESTPYLQIHDSYIVEQTDQGFVIIDQHALHERMLYETLQGRLRKDRLEAQRLLLPETLEATHADASAIERHAELFGQLGIELVSFGPRTYAIQSFPTLLARVPPHEFVRDLVDLLVERREVVSKQDLFNDILSMAACKAAIKAGQKLSDSEIRQLLADRDRFESTTRCPHGRPTTLRFSLSELEKQFKRT